MFTEGDKSILMSAVEKAEMNIQFSGVLKVIADLAGRMSCEASRGNDTDCSMHYDLVAAMVRKTANEIEARDEEYNYNRLPWYVGKR